MLSHLSVRDFAIIDKLDLPLDAGMTVVTGETGAGKSIVIDALTLVLGGRARTELIRNGCDKATASAQFVASAEVKKSLFARLENAGLPPCDDDALVVRRILSATGRHKQFINGALCTVSQLKDVLEPLIDITSQHAEQALKESSSQRAWLDAFGKHEGLVASFAKSYQVLKALVQEHEALQAAEREGQSRLDWLRFQIDEIETLDPQENELDGLKSERARLKNMSVIRQSVEEAMHRLCENEEDALSNLQAASHRLTSAHHGDEDLGAIVTSLDEAVAIVDDVARQLERYSQNLQADPERLEAIDERVDGLQKLARKHGDDVMVELERMRDELDRIENSEERLAALDAEIQEQRVRLEQEGKKLTQARTKTSSKLKKAVEAELKDLGMQKAKIEFAISPLTPRASALLSTDESRAFSPHGADAIEVMLQANPGEEFAPLKKAASGGELSRVQLALKRVLLEKDPVPVTIFDEVDAGVSGAVAAAIGEKLRAVSNKAQVIVISHSPQIASCAHAQLEVRKEVSNERTRSIVQSVEGAARVDAIAKMLGGKTLTDAARASATELLSASGGIKTKKTSASPRSTASKKVAKKASVKKASAKKVNVKKVPTKKASVKKASAKKVPKKSRGRAAR